MFLFNFILLFSDDNLCKQFGPRSGPKMFYTQIVFLKDIIEKVNLKQMSAMDNKNTKHAKS